MADWASIKRDIAAFDCRYIDRKNVDDAERFLHNNLFSILCIHIPKRTLHDRKSAHPWVTQAFIRVRKSNVCKTLRKINIYSGTGPDLLASRVLVECSEELSLPLAKFIRRIIALGSWPTA